MEDYIPQLGPKEVVIPEQRYLSCHGCKFYEDRMIVSGLNPIYGDYCNNPHIPEANKIRIVANLPNGYRTPNWCPYQNINEDK